MNTIGFGQNKWIIMINCFKVKVLVLDSQRYKFVSLRGRAISWFFKIKKKKKADFYPKFKDKNQTTLTGFRTVPKPRSSSEIHFVKSIVESQIDQLYNNCLNL